MRVILVLVLSVLAFAACGRPDPARTQSTAPRATEPRIAPSVTTPGVHISGQVNIGVKGSF